MAAGGGAIAAGAPGDEDRFLTVRSCEHVRIIRAWWGYLGNIINLISRLTKRVHNLALDALVREVSHSGAYWKDYIEAKDVHGVLDRREHALPCQRRIETSIWSTDSQSAR